jgi:ligand-binding sensor domain-containing protein
MADEHYYFKNLSVQNGLSQNTVNAILQDRQGFMWFGTKDGLNRYDGLSFRKFKHDDRTRRSIGNNFITALYEDAKGDIWVSLLFSIIAELFGLVAMVMDFSFRKTVCKPFILMSRL